MNEGYLSISAQAFRRLPQYYHYLKQLSRQGVETVSAPAIAKTLRLNEVQVRKDLAAVSESGGKPRTGFEVAELLGSIERSLGYDNLHDAVLVGAGHLGSALLSYNGFEEYGVKIVAAFDSDPGCIGKDIHGTTVFSIEKLVNLCRRMQVHIGIITVPALQAQKVCDALVEGGVLAVWNFAPAHLTVPEHILVQNENMAMSLAILSNRITQSLAGKQEGSLDE